MIGVDFRTPGAAEQLQGAVARLLGRARAFRLGLLVIGMLFAFVGVEVVRLGSALHNVQDLERRRDALMLDVQNMRARVKAIRDRRIALLTALARRRSNADLAARIASASDLLATSMALTQLRAAPEGLDIEGRGTNLTDIRASLGRLESTFDRFRDRLSCAATMWCGVPSRFISTSRTNEFCIVGSLNVARIRLSGRIRVDPCRRRCACHGSRSRDRVAKPNASSWGKRRTLRAIGRVTNCGSALSRLAATPNHGTLCRSRRDCTPAKCASDDVPSRRERPV